MPLTPPLSRINDLINLIRLETCPRIYYYKEKTMTLLKKNNKINKHGIDK